MSSSAKPEKKPHIGRIFLLALISLVLGVNLYMWNAKNLVGNALPMPFGYGISVVLSGSMEPALAVDDLVFLHRTQDIAEGDIIVYQSGYELIIHRVIAIEGETLRTQGDANSAADAPITLASVKGKMIGRLPLAGKLVRFMKKPAVVIVILAAAVLLVELSYRRERMQDTEETERIKEEIRRLKEEQANEDRDR